MSNIYIKPCDKGWQNMTPQNDGRFCDSCSLVVVDFSAMSTAEIEDYFKRRSGQKICGHYRNDSIHLVPPKTGMGRLARLMTLLTFLFGSLFVSSCRRHTQRSTHSDGVRIYDFKSPDHDNHKEDLSR